MATQIPDLTAADFTSRLVNLLPADWFSDAAKAPGGKFYTLMLAIASELEFLNDGVVYAYNSGRINSATGSALDEISATYFGTRLPRYPSETDDSFRSRLVDALLPEGVTRNAIYNAILKTTGVAPRLMEPWSPIDTAVWDLFSYWDVDVEGSTPFRWGSPELRHQGFAEITLPSPTNQSTNPVWCYDAGFSFDIPNCAWNDPQSSFFVQQEEVDAAINAVKAQGTIVWRKFR